MDKINRQKNTIHEKWKCFIIFMYEKYYQEEKKIDSQEYPGSCLLQFWMVYNIWNSALLLSVQSTSTNESVFAFVLQVAQQRQRCIVSIPVFTFESFTVADVLFRSDLYLSVSRYGFGLCSRTHACWCTHCLLGGLILWTLK